MHPHQSLIFVGAPQLSEVYSYKRDYLLLHRLFLHSSFQGCSQGFKVYQASAQKPDVYQMQRIHYSTYGLLMVNYCYLKVLPHPFS